MEYKMFGPGRSPSEGFRRRLETLFALDQTDWDMIGKWFLTTDSFDPDGAISFAAFVGSSMTPEQTAESIEVLKFILEAWHMRGLDLQAIQRDLMLLGQQPEDIERLGLFLKRLSSVRDRAWANYMRSEVENAVLPTLEDIEIICDLRPIFEDDVYPLPETGTIDHKKLLGFAYMILAELRTEDGAGMKQRLAFQMTEQGLSGLEAAIRRAKDQLDIPKARTHALSVEDQ